MLVAWAAALPSPLLPASAARIAERGGASLVAAEELLADVLAPPAWAILRYLLRERPGHVSQLIMSVGSGFNGSRSGAWCLLMEVAQYCWAGWRGGSGCRAGLLQVPE